MIPRITEVRKENSVSYCGGKRTRKIAKDTVTRSLMTLGVKHQKVIKVNEFLMCKSRETSHLSSSCQEKKATGVLPLLRFNYSLEHVLSVSPAMGIPATGKEKNSLQKKKRAFFLGTVFPILQNSTLWFHSSVHTPSVHQEKEVNIKKDSEAHL